jgi:hypothetical protein
MIPEALSGSELGPPRESILARTEVPPGPVQPKNGPPLPGPTALRVRPKLPSVRQSNRWPAAPPTRSAETPASRGHDAAEETPCIRPPSPATTMCPWTASSTTDGGRIGTGFLNYPSPHEQEFAMQRFQTPAPQNSIPYLWVAYGKRIHGHGGAILFDAFNSVAAVGQPFDSKKGLHRLIGR